MMNIKRAVKSIGKSDKDKQFIKWWGCTEQEFLNKAKSLPTECLKGVIEKSFFLATEENAPEKEKRRYELLSKLL